MEVKQKVTTAESGTQVSYILRNSQFMTISGDIDRINTFIANDKNNNDFDIEMFEKSFKNNLKQYDVVLSDLEFPKD
jgi:hypothetical protein